MRPLLIAGAHPGFARNPARLKAPVPPVGDPRQPLGASPGRISILRAGETIPAGLFGSSIAGRFISRINLLFPRFPKQSNSPGSRGIQGTPWAGPLSHRLPTQQDFNPLPLQNSRKLGKLPRHLPELWAPGSALPLAGTGEGTAKRSCDKSICTLVTLGTKHAPRARSRGFRARSGLPTRSPGTQTICREEKALARLAVYSRRA